MLTVNSIPLELRGVAHKTTKQNKTYYIVNCEIADGTAYQFYCPDANALPAGLKKGDMVIVTFEVLYFNGNERLVVRGLKKA